MLLCGSCLVASTEVIRSFPNGSAAPRVWLRRHQQRERFEGMSQSLPPSCANRSLLPLSAHADMPSHRIVSGTLNFPEDWSKSCKLRPAKPPPITSRLATTEPAEIDGFTLTRMAVVALRNSKHEPALDIDNASNVTDLPSARKVLARLRKAISAGKENLLPFAQAVEVEIAITQAKTDEAVDGFPDVDPLFRVNMNEWALEDGKLGSLTPVRNGQFRILRFERDISDLLRVQSVSEFPSALGPGPSHVVVFGDTSKEPLLVDRFTARILELSDGTRTGNEIIVQLGQEFGRQKSDDQLAWVENLLLLGALGLILTRAPKPSMLRADARSTCKGHEHDP